MFEIDFLPVGDGQDSGDAIAMRFTRPDTGAYAHVVVDAGFQDDGDAIVAHMLKYYDTDTVDLAIVTHPDGDHIGGMGTVVRDLRVRELWLHNLGAHGGASLPAADAVSELIKVAQQRGTRVREPWAGAQRFGGALTILGPDTAYYDQLVAEQLEAVAQKVAIGGRGRLLEAARGLVDRLVTAMPVEIPFAAKAVNPRNNSSMITLVTVDDKRVLLTGDAGVPALERAWDHAEQLGRAETPTFVQIPHHGSRRNCSSAWLDRLLGPTGQTSTRSAFVSVVAESDKHPSGKVLNAYTRRGCAVLPTAGSTKWHYTADAPPRHDFSLAQPLGPMDESDED
jgi:beta-lactamase superfamily II metal-dependent hydrolase